MLGTGIGLTVVIPMKNAAGFIASTLRALSLSVVHAGLSLEVWIVDDGCTDESLSEIYEAKPYPGLNIVVMNFDSEGRFQSRLEAAKLVGTEWILFVDSRVLVSPTTVANLVKMASNADLEADLVGVHVVSHESSQFPTLVWDVITHVFWDIEKVLASDSLRITSENFDIVPKGTTTLLARREVFLSLAERVSLRFAPFQDVRFVNDDTVLLRLAAAEHHYIYDTKTVVFHRSNRGVKSFLLHTFARGRVAVSGLLLSGPSGSFHVLVTLVGIPALSFWFLLSLWMGPGWLINLVAYILLGGAITGLAVRRGASHRSAAAFLLFAGPFFLVYWSGQVVHLFDFLLVSTREKFKKAWRRRLAGGS